MNRRAFLLGLSALPVAGIPVTVPASDSVYSDFAYGGWDGAYHIVFPNRNVWRWDAEAQTWWRE